MLKKKQPIAYSAMGLLDFQTQFPGERECYEYIDRCGSQEDSRAL